MLLDCFTIIYWWLILLGLGVLFLPFSFKLFERFWDKGWIFSKIIGIIFVSYAVFILGRIHFLPFFRETILLVILLAIGLNIWFQKKKKFSIVSPFESIKIWLKENRKIILIEEGFFLGALIFWSFVRGFAPEIRGLEKFMDFGFVNSILRSNWFPPHDMWFSGQGINYYYFGHLETAALTKLSGIDSAITYNLMIATLFAFAFAATFSLVSNLICLTMKQGNNVAINKFVSGEINKFVSGEINKFVSGEMRKIIVGGLVSALLISLGGNLHTIVYVLKDGASKYWYPDATRYIGYNPPTNDKTIHEFPAYSFVVSDLHGHVNDIPTVLLFLAVLLVFGLKIHSEKDLKIENLKLKILLIAWLLAVMYMTNSWNFPIYGVLFGFFMLLVSLAKHKKLVLGNIWESVKETFLVGAVVLVAAIIFALPFAISFDPMSQGIGFVRAHSPLYQLLVLWGFFWFIAFGFTAFALYLIKAGQKLDISQILVLSAAVWSTILIIIPEIIYVKDIYIPEHHRSNTMFKLVYQSFMMYCLAAGFVLIQIRETKTRGAAKILKTIFLIVFCLGFSAQMIYPHFSIKGYYGKLLPSRYQGLDGLKFMSQDYPDDYEAVLWLRQNIVGAPVVLEAVGDSYTDYERISMATGLPTIEGWLVHEWLWRGGFDQPGKRASEVEQVYQSDDLETTKLLLNKYNVEYVVVGGMEREKYPQLKDWKFSSLGEPIFESGNLRIYKIHEFRISNLQPVLNIIAKRETRKINEI